MTNFWDETSREAFRARAPRMAQPASYVRPTTASGEPYVPSYTRYLNSPGSSYVHPLHNLFNDRRPKPQSPRSTLRRQES